MVAEETDNRAGAETSRPDRVIAVILDMLVLMCWIITEKNAQLVNS